MAHYCRICGAYKPNEQFSGRGHRTHVCKKCARLPKFEREAIEQQAEIANFMDQSHISKKNVARLCVLTASENPETATLAKLVLEVAKIKPYKRRRLKLLAQSYPELLVKLEEAGLIFRDDFEIWDGFSCEDAEA